MMPKTKEEKLQLITNVTVAIFVGFVSFVSVIVGLYVVIGNITRPRIHYTKSTLTSDYLVCPGDVLSFETELMVEAEKFRPTQILITVSIWDVLNGRTIEFEEDPRYSAWTDPILIVYTESHVVPDIPPGTYEIRHATLMFSGGNDVTTIPFFVSNLCDK